MNDILNFSSDYGEDLDLFSNNHSKNYLSNNITDMDNIENEMNELSDDINSSPSFYDNDITNNDISSFEDNNLGFDTANLSSSDNNKWDNNDGYNSFSNIPVNPDAVFSEPKMTKEEIMREKFKYLKKLEALEKKGVILTQKYNMDSNLNEMKGEYEMIVEEKNKQNSIKFQGNMMMMFVNGLEFLNGKFDPFDIKLDGWGEQIGENMSDYDEIFSELYEKYKSKASMAPELKLLFQLGGSAFMVHMTNSMFGNSMPKMDDIMKQNPDLARQFQQAAVNSMSAGNPGFSNFMNNVVQPTTAPHPINHGPPPPPIATQTSKQMSDRHFRPNLSSTAMFQDEGMSLGSHDLLPANTKRPDMRGPSSDVSELLSGLKTKTINIPTASATSLPRSLPLSQSLPLSHSLQQTSSNNSVTSDTAPKRSKRRNRSDKNSVSLDL